MSKKKHKKIVPDKKISTNKKLVLFSLIIVIFAFWIYSNTFDASFHLDDEPNITKNKKVLNDISKIWEFSPNRFLGYLTFAINYNLHKFEVYHHFYLLKYVKSIGKELLYMDLNYQILELLEQMFQNQKKR